METILTTDIGGTNSRFAAFKTNERGELTFLNSVWLKTWDATSFDHLLENLKKKGFSYSPENCDVTVAAVPGPVENKCTANLANVPWKVDVSHLQSLYGANRIHLINDFVAQAFACRTTAVFDAKTIKEGIKNHDAPLSVVGAGTGLGHCSMIPDGHGGFISLPSEGGHAAFAFVNNDEMDYENFVKDKLHIPYAIGDVIVSGKGLQLLYEFHHGEEIEPKEIDRRIDDNDLVTQWFARFYARVCRQYALAILPLGGMYLAGGVAAKNPSLADHDAFREEFVSSAAHSEMLDQIPVYLNTNEESGLWGGAFYGLIAMGIPPLQGTDTSFSEGVQAGS